MCHRHNTLQSYGPNKYLNRSIVKQEYSQIIEEDYPDTNLSGCYTVLNLNVMHGGEYRYIMVLLGAYRKNPEKGHVKLDRRQASWVYFLPII